VNFGDQAAISSSQAAEGDDIHIVIGAGQATGNDTGMEVLELSVADAVLNQVDRR